MTVVLYPHGRTTRVKSSTVECHTNIKAGGNPPAFSENLSLLLASLVFTIDCQGTEAAGEAEIEMMGFCL